MKFKSLIPYALSLLLLSLGAAGAVAAFNSPAAHADKQTQTFAEAALGTDAKTDDHPGVVLDSSRSLRGRVTVPGGFPPEHSPSLHFTRAGESVRSVYLAQDGRFSVADLNSGTYGLSLATSDSFLAFSVFVASGNGPRPAAPEPGLQIDAMASLPSDYELVSSLVQDSAVLSESVTPLATGTKLPPVDRPAAKDTAGSAAIKPRSVRLTPDGTLNGIVHKPIDGPNGTVEFAWMSGVELTFVHNNQSVATVTTNADGRFHVDDVFPGEYSLVARGAAGIAVLGIQVSESAPATVNHGDLPSESQSLQYVSANIQNGSNHPAAGSNDVRLDISLTDTLILPQADVATQSVPFGAGSGLGVSGGSGGGRPIGGLVGGLLAGGLIGGLADRHHHDPPASPDNVP